MLGLGERERAQLVQSRHRGQPALLLLLGSEHRDRAHGQPGLHSERGAEAAVAAVELHVHEPGCDRAHVRTAVALDPVANQPQLAQALQGSSGSSARSQ